MLTLFERVSRIENDPVTATKTLQNFQRHSVVAADGKRLQMKLMIRIHCNRAKALRAEQQGVYGNLQALACDLDP